MNYDQQCDDDVILKNQAWAIRRADGTLATEWISEDRNRLKQTLATGETLVRVEIRIIPETVGEAR